jgi:hypothetical protein
MVNPKRTEPTRSLLKGAEYVNAASTDIRARFERIRAEQAAKKQQHVKPVRSVAK